MQPSRLEYKSLANGSELWVGGCFADGWHRRGVRNQFLGCAEFNLAMNFRHLDQPIQFRVKATVELYCAATPSAGPPSLRQDVDDGDGLKITGERVGLLTPLVFDGTHWNKGFERREGRASLQMTKRIRARDEKHLRHYTLKLRIEMRPPGDLPFGLPSAGLPTLGRRR